MKQCTKCLLDKEESEFSKKRNSLHSYCKLCFNLYCREHYRKNAQNNRDRIYRKKSLLSKYVTELKAACACLDCGQRYPYYVMDFDHRPEFKKIAEIRELVRNGSMSSLLEEIKKCDLVCSNCHRIRAINAF